MVRPVVNILFAVRSRHRAALALVAAAILTATTPRAAPAQSAAPGAPPTVPVVKPRAQPVTDYVELTGNAQAINTVKLVARVEGYLEAQHFADGATVKKGDLLFTVQPDQYKAQLTQAQAQVLTAKSGVKYARTEVARYRALVKQDAAAQTQVDHWVHEQESSEASLMSAEAQVVLAQLNLSYTEIRAPFDGQMGKAQIYPGNVVGGPGQQSTLAEIIQLDPIYVVANLSEQDALKIRQNLNQQRLTQAEMTKVPIEVALQDETRFTHRGTLEYVAPGIDPATGTVLVRGKLDNPNHDLMPGFFVRIRLPVRRGTQQALLVPDRALQEDQGGRYLLTVNHDGIVEKHYVQLGQVFEGLRAILSGIAAGDDVVVGALWRATPGMKVVPQPTPIEGPPGARP